MFLSPICENKPVVKMDHQSTLSLMAYQMLNHFINLSKNGVSHQDLQPSRIKQDLKDVQSVIDLLKYTFITQLRNQA